MPPIFRGAASFTFLCNVFHFLSQITLLLSWHFFHRVYSRRREHPGRMASHGDPLLIPMDATGSLIFFSMIFGEEGVNYSHGIIGSHGGWRRRGALNLEA